MYSDKYEPSDYWSDGVIFDAKEMAALMGIAIDKIYFTGFWSQGDGACFTGNFYLSGVASAELKASAPTEVELHQLVDELAELARAYPNIQGAIDHIPSHYYHSNTMSTGYWSSDDGCYNKETEAFAAADAETTLIKVFRRLADWIYEKLEQAYDFAKADSHVRGYVECYEQIVNTQAAAQLLSSQLAEHSLPPFATDAVLQRIAELDSQVTELEVEMEWLADTFHYFEDIKPLTIQKYAQMYMGFVFPDEE